MSRDILLNLIDPDPNQPRKHFDEASLKELAASIEANGLAVPILLRPNGERFIIVHGERRWRAFGLLDRESIPAEVREIGKDEAGWLALVENVQRNDLSPIEEAQAYQARLDQGLTQKELGRRIGKTQSYIASKLRLLKLPSEVQTLVNGGSISEGHAKQILRFPDKDRQLNFTQMIINDGLPVAGIKQKVDDALELERFLDGLELPAKKRPEELEKIVYNNFWSLAQDVHQMAQIARDARNRLPEDQFNDWIQKELGWSKLFGRWILSLAEKHVYLIADRHEWIERALVGESRDVRPEDLIIDHDHRARSTINMSIVDEYRDEMRDGDVFPPLLVVEMDSRLWLSDGFHRYHAHRGVGAKRACVKVEQGGFEDIFSGGCRANARHGLALTREEKEYAKKKFGYIT